jgi:hypothetical protein
MHRTFLDTRVLADPAWWHWAITIPLLAAHVFALPWAIEAALGSHGRVKQFTAYRTLKGFLLVRSCRSAGTTVVHLTVTSHGPQFFAANSRRKAFALSKGGVARGDRPQRRSNVAIVVKSRTLAVAV